jgi:hypothetical protein
MNAGKANLKALAVNFAATFAIAFVVAAISTLIWNLIQSGTATVEWASAFRLAIIIGIAFPLVEALRNKSKLKNVH